MPSLIHVLEDDEDIREIIGCILTDAGYLTQLSACVREFNKLIKVTLPDLILMDVRLPDGNGKELCHRIKQNTATANIPVILISASANRHMLLEESLADDFISKPFDIYFLIDTITSKLPGSKKQ